eukprot:scaffold2365_cov109-Skeletonema_marinoi.AAC.2
MDCGNGSHHLCHEFDKNTATKAIIIKDECLFVVDMHFKFNVCSVGVGADRDDISRVNYGYEYLPGG